MIGRGWKLGGHCSPFVTQEYWCREVCCGLYKHEHYSVMMGCA